MLASQTGRGPVEVGPLKELEQQAPQSPEYSLLALIFYCFIPLLLHNL